ncbi:MAG: ABC transporter ATP-binding protein [Rubrivivax sp.]
MSTNRANRATSTVLRAQEVSVMLGTHRALDRVSCRFERGWTAIVGPNGSGKSTLLRVLAGLLTPAAGQVELDGSPLAMLAPRERGRRLAWLAQSGEGSGELDARETVALGRLPHLGLVGVPTAADEAAVDRAMASTECIAWQHRLLTELSGGERQRVLLARALATEAGTLLLDEPTTHLDPPHQVALVRLVRKLAATHTVVTVLHDLPLALHADRVLVLQQGRVAAEGTFDDPALHAALMAVFDGAVRVEVRNGNGRPTVVPNLD